MEARLPMLWETDRFVFWAEEDEDVLLLLLLLILLILFIVENVLLGGGGGGGGSKKAASIKASSQFTLCCLHGSRVSRNCLIREIDSSVVKPAGVRFKWR